jgi:hypothetical protein
MSFIRTREIKGKLYRYEETRWREGGKVRSRSVSLGPVSSDEGWLRRQMGRSHGVNWDKIAKEEIARQDAEKGKLSANIDRLHTEFGLNMGPASPVEVEKPAPTVDLSSPEAAPAAEKDASPNGEADANGTPDQ